MFFARARELAGLKQLDAFGINNPATVARLLDALVKRLPSLGEVMQSCEVAVNQEYVDQEHVLQVRV